MLKEKFDIRNRPKLSESEYDKLPVELRKRFKPDTSFYMESEICVKCEMMRQNCQCEVREREERERIYKFWGESKLLTEGKGFCARRQERREMQKMQDLIDNKDEILVFPDITYKEKTYKQVI